MGYMYKHTTQLRHNPKKRAGVIRVRSSKGEYGEGAQSEEGGISNVERGVVDVEQSSIRRQV